VQFLQLIISGVAQGCIYGLIALGFVLIYKATETVSFAQGELMMLGAFGGLACMTFLGFPFWLAVPCAIAAMALFGMGLERLVIRPILGQPAFSIVMLTIGIGYVARGVITMVPNIGTETHTLPVPYKDQAWNVGALVLNVEQMVVIASTAALSLLLYAMFKYSKLGIAMQASSQNQLAAYYMGIPVKRLNGMVWGLAAAVAAIAGLLLHDVIETTLRSPKVIAATTIGYGLLLLLADRIGKQGRDEYSFRWRDAALVACAQALALVPGTSRSGATIIGGLFVGLSRKAATEFSFFLAIPTMLAATVYDVYKHHELFRADDVALMATGFIAAFLAAFFTVKALVAFVAQHSFTPFAWYRIAFGLLVLALYAGGVITWQGE